MNENSNQFENNDEEEREENEENNNADTLNQRDGDEQNENEKNLDQNYNNSQTNNNVNISDNGENPNEMLMIYEWIDSLSLSKPKKNISRDFSDAKLLAEVIKIYFPKLIQMHNYPETYKTTQKIENWKMLNSKHLLLLL